jgi:hypothetical protein
MKLFYGHKFRIKLIDYINYFCAIPATVRALTLASVNPDNDFSSLSTYLDDFNAAQAQITLEKTSLPATIKLKEGPYESY